MTIDSPTVHRYADSRDAYDASQTYDTIKDGDVLVIEPESVVGILVSAWPVAVTSEPGCFHRLKFHQLDDGAWTNFDGKDYTASAALARTEMEKLGLAVSV